MELVFCCGLFALVYCYLGYPLLLALFAAAAGKRARGRAAEAYCPSVAVLVSVYNEETRIQAKIDNFRSLDYPAEKLDLWIGSDASTDRTAEIVRACGDDRVHVVESTVRSGKTAVLNRLASRTEADVLLFTDVNAMFRPDAVGELTAALSDPRVGLASGRTMAPGAVEGAYYRYESWLRTKESLRNCLSGADGAIYAMRRSLYEDLPPDVINDFAHPCHVVWRGYAARFVPGAVCEEAASNGVSQEFQRQTRMASQALYVYFHFVGRLLRAGKLRFVWILTSHKLLRWLGLVWMFLVAAGTVWMARESTSALLFLGAQLVFVALAGAATAFPRLAHSRVGQLPQYFILIHLAYLRGVFKCLAGERYVTWEPRAG